MEKLKLLLDVDEVICFSGYLRFVNEFLGTNYVIDDFTDYYIDEVVIPKERMDEFNRFIQDKDQYEDAVFLPKAVEAVTRLSEYFDIYLCSDCRNPFDIANSGRIFMSKFNLLFNTFPQDVIPAKNYIFTGTKNMFKGDIQVDDLLSNLNTDIPKKYLFPSYHNRNIKAEDLSSDIIKVSDDWRTGWEELEKALMKIIYEREDNTLKKFL